MKKLIIQKDKSFIYLNKEYYNQKILNQLIMDFRNLALIKKIDFKNYICLEIKNKKQINIKKLTLEIINYLNGLNFQYNQIE
jgi:G:T-mismatch repair DNA endonuclease (very short patch repair protein)